MYHGERLNSWTHLGGTLLAVLGTTALLLPALQQGDGWKTLGFAVYGASLIALYLSSTLFHSSREGYWKQRFALCDHCAIYLLIAGTYTPLCLVTLRGHWGGTVLMAVWVLALLGIVRELFGRQQARPSVWLYVLLGWCGLSVIRPLCQQLAPGGLLWLALGAVLYTAGTVFYLNDKRWRHAHGIWHVFVLAGSACHYYVFFGFVA